MKNGKGGYGNVSRMGMYLVFSILVNVGQLFKASRGLSQSGRGYGSNVVEG